MANGQVWFKEYLLDTLQRLPDIFKQEFEGAWSSTEPHGGKINNIFMKTTAVNSIYSQASMTWTTECWEFFPPRR